jgi:hypothetical protein
VLHFARSGVITKGCGMRNCEHLSYSIRKTRDTQVNDNGSTLDYFLCTCTECGETWNTIRRNSDNILLVDYLEHFNKKKHSSNSPHIKTIQEDETQSGERYPDMCIVYVPCDICKKWASQQHHQEGVRDGQAI